MDKYKIKKWCDLVWEQSQVSKDDIEWREYGKNMRRFAGFSRACVKSIGSILRETGKEPTEENIKDALFKLPVTMNQIYEELIKASMTDGKVDFSKIRPEGEFGHILFAFTKDNESMQWLKEGLDDFYGMIHHSMVQSKFSIFSEDGGFKMSAENGVVRIMTLEDLLAHGSTLWKYTKDCGNYSEPFGIRTDELEEVREYLNSKEYQDIYSGISKVEETSASVPTNTKTEERINA